MELKLRKKQLKGKTFYKEDFRESEIIKSTFHQCTFKNVDFRYSYIRASEFRNVVFEQVRFTYSHLVKTSFDKFAVKFYRCKFIKTHFNQLFASSCTFENCEFIDCKFTATDFGGSRLINVKFTGEVDGIFSREGHETKGGLWHVIMGSYRHVKTIYKNVDFSNAILNGVAFYGGFDAKEINFGASSDYIITKRPHELYDYIKDFISNNWQGKDREVGLRAVEYLYKPFPNQENAFYDSNFLTDELMLEIFRLMKRENERLE